MNEASKLRARWQREGLIERYFRGHILDIGCGDDKILPEAVGWDREQGDAQLLAGVSNESYDTVFSSHCLEHLRDPLEALLNWWRVLSPGGHLILVVPDEDLYERCRWPHVNPEHRYTFTVSKDVSWSPVTRNLTTLLGCLANRKVISIRTIDDGYDYTAPAEMDQTLTVAEASIEAIAQKQTVVRPWDNMLQSVAVCPFCKTPRLYLLGTSRRGWVVSQCLACGKWLEVKTK